MTTVQRQTAAERLAEHVRRTVAALPPLTDEQRDRVSALLSPSTNQPKERTA